MRSSFFRTVVWITWSIIWIISNKILMSMGLIAHRGWFMLLIDCALSCLAALIITSKCCLGYLTLILFIITLIKNFNGVGIYSFIMGIVLIILTAITNPPKEI